MNVSIKILKLQFEPEFKPSKLRNWEVPKWFPERPCGNKGKLASISNEHGHLLPGVPRSLRNPWGDFVGTWNLPKKIDRKLATELSAPRQDKILKWKRHCEQQGGPLPRMPKITRDKVPTDLPCLPTLPAPPEKQKTERAVTAPQPSDKLDEVKVDSNVDESGEQGEHKLECEEKLEAIDEKGSQNVERRARTYIPGEFTNFKQQDPSHDDLAANKFDHDIKKYPAKGYPKYREDFSNPEPTPPHDLKQEAEKVYEQQKEMMSMKHSEAKRNGGNNLSPYRAVASNFALAKRLAKENLEHEPLPDTIAEALYRKMQLQKDSEPGLLLKDGNYATGVGWKGYPGYGATRCTKLKVFRPKTCIHGKLITKTERPSSVSSFDKKWRFIRQQKVSPIELAICWDLTPMNAEDEPKRTKHIDGSNGSQAPAVFSLVHTPKDESARRHESNDAECDGHNCITEAENNQPNLSEVPQTRPKTAWQNKKSDSSSSSSNSSKSNLQRAKSAYNIQEEHKEKASTKSSSNSGISKKKLYQSTPNLTDCSNSYKYCSKECYKQGKNKVPNSRLCMACEMKNVKLKERPKSEYKMAFKAGVPNNTKRRENRQDYPEHWRLASIYQHSYKPLHLRKRPLITSVFQ